jgi:hypothetical protein
MKIKFKKTHLILLSLLFIFSCEIMTPEDVTKDYNIFYVPEYVVKAIDIPPRMLESSDSVAQMVVDYLIIYNDTERYVDLFSFSDIDSFDYTSEQPWIKKIQTAKGTEITVTQFHGIHVYNLGTHNYYTWDVQISGIDSSTGKSYDNWRSTTADMVDGEETDLTLYDENSTNLQYRIFWNSQSAYQDHYEINCFEGDSITYMIQFDIGSSNRFRKRVDTRGWGYEWYTWLEYSVRWYSDGRGEWTQYSESREEVASGNW